MDACRIYSGDRNNRMSYFHVAKCKKNNEGEFLRVWGGATKWMVLYTEARKTVTEAGLVGKINVQIEEHMFGRKKKPQCLL